MTVSKREPSEPSPDSVIWRYMDDWKFKLLLSRFTEQKLWQPERPGRRTVYFNDPGQVWFAFPSTFGDLNETKEGMFPDANEDPEQFCDRMAAHMKLSKEDATAMKGRWLKSRTKSVRDGIFFMAQLCGVSSWNANQNESQSMWRDFVHEQNDVARMLNMRLDTCSPRLHAVLPRLSVKLDTWIILITSCRMKDTLSCWQLLMKATRRKTKYDSSQNLLSL